MENTLKEFDLITKKAREVFEKKLSHYGCSWRILRPTSITDQIFIKIKRARNIQEKKIQKVGDEGIEEDFLAIANYSIIGLIQIEKGITNSIDLCLSNALDAYDRKIDSAKKLLENKNHDYDESWKIMHIHSLTDMIFQKVLRLKHIQQEEKDSSLAHKRSQDQYIDIFNYALFVLMRNDTNSAKGI